MIELPAEGEGTGELPDKTVPGDHNPWADAKVNLKDGGEKGRFNVKIVELRGNPKHSFKAQRGGPSLEGNTSA